MLHATARGVDAGIGLVTSPEWAPAVYDIRVSINSHTAIMHNGRKTRKPYRWWLKKYASTNAGGQWASPNVPGSCQLLALHMAGIWPPARWVARGDNHMGVMGVEMGVVMDKLTRWKQRHCTMSACV